jgi:hypothetical protein
MLETDTIECPALNGGYEVISNIHDNPELVKDWRGRENE